MLVIWLCLHDLKTCLARDNQEMVCENYGKGQREPGKRKSPCKDLAVPTLAALCQDVPSAFACLCRLETKFSRIADRTLQKRFIQVAFLFYPQPKKQ